MSHKPSVSVIIISYNTRELTLKSIKSVYDSEGFDKKDLEVIVIDNDSHDGTITAVKQTYPQVVCIQNTDNVGFGAANNQGIARAKGEYILLLNSDAFLQADSLSIMYRLITSGGYRAVGPRLVYEDGSFQPSAGLFPTPLRILAWMIWLDKLPFINNHAYHLMNPGWYQLDGQPDWLMGACILFRQDTLNKVGGFDEKMFMYAEEVELFLRLKQNILYTPEAVVTHLGGKSGGTQLLSELKGIEYIYRKHYPGLYWYLKILLKLGIILRIIIYRMIPTKKDTIKQYEKYL